MIFKLHKNQALIIFVLLSVYASALNYLAYPLLGRLLPSAQYIDITVALSLFTQIGTFMSALIAVTIGLSKQDRKKSEKLVANIQTAMLQLLLVLGVFFLLVSPLIMPLIHTPTPYALPIVLMLLVSVPLTILSGYFNGKNLLPQLGMIAAVTATLQLLVGITTAYIFENGLVTMLCMGIAQLLAVMILYLIFRSYSPPKVSRIATLTAWNPSTIKIVRYTILASIAIMTINILQIADLLIINTLSSANHQLYTDIYVISRVVFFAGTIFIWPFLGEVDSQDHRKNFKPLAKLTGIFVLLGTGALAGIWLFGPWLFEVLFGRTYSTTDILLLAVLSVVYKLLYLFITALSLLLVVKGTYLPLVGASISGVLSILVFIFKPFEPVSTLLLLNGIALLTTVLCFIWFFRLSKQTKDRLV